MQTLEDSQDIIAKTQEWLEKAVIGLNLCPFAKSVYIKNQIRFKVSPATTVQELREDFMVEMQLLADTKAEEIDTTLLIHPYVLLDFLEYNDFLDVADGTLVEMKLEGILQVASFHPQYQFAGTTPEDITNYTNRTPYPTLHLLREEILDKAIDSHLDVDGIPERNMETMRKLGLSGWEKLFLKKPH